MNNNYQVYSDIELSTEVMAASSHRLVQLLLEKCLQQIYITKVAITEKQYNQKHKSIARIRDILNYLRECLNLNDEQTRAMSTLLDSLYVYIEKNIIKAALENDTQYLDQSYELLSTIKAGWDGIKPENNK